MSDIVACRTYGLAIDYSRVALRRPEYRDYDSVSIALQATNGDVARLRRGGRIGALDRRVRDRSGPQCDGARTGHTRWATHGASTVG